MGGMLKIAVAATKLIALLGFEHAHAIDLSGAWATNADQCSRVFVRKSRANQVGFTSFLSSMEVVSS